MTTVNTTYTAKKIDEQRFEFVLFINDKIICQRYFNVRDYNKDVVNSLELKELMDILTGKNINDLGNWGIIPNFLKKRTIDYLWDNYNPYYIQTEDESKNNFDKIDSFQFEIKVDKEVISKSYFPANSFSPKVRYSVDIKELIPSIITEIRDYLSLKTYTAA